MSSSAAAAAAVLPLSLGLSSNAGKLVVEMEGGGRGHGDQGTPERVRAWQSELASPVGRKIPVVYYLCRNRRLEHPHFIQVPLSSPDGLFLRDVINRLDELRGKGMPAMYSWSCKRSYKNGFVWQDLADDDLVLPANGDEYVLKGTELLHQSSSVSGRIQQGNGNCRLPILNPQQQDGAIFSAGQEASPVIEGLKKPASPPWPQGDGQKPSSPANGRSFRERRSCKPVEASDASTQTDDSPPSTEFDPAKPQSSDLRSKGGSNAGADENDSFSSGKMETLESLIRADAGRINSFRVLEEEEVLFHTGPKLRPTSVLMQLITCGAISVKDHQSFGLVPTYKPSFSHAKLPSPMFSRSTMHMHGELDCLPDNNRRLIALRFDDKECFSGSLVETKKHRSIVGEMAAPTLKRSSSYNATDRSCKTPDSKQVIANLTEASRPKCLPRVMKSVPNKQSKDEAIRLSFSDAPRKSSVELHCRESSNEEIQSMGPSGNAPSTGVESLEGKTDKLIKIEERLISGARVTIQSRAPCDASEDSDS
ncbi:protein SOSEKI 3-like isoform X1 [Zingiber officinale]|uniref:protein SOSEKI 3-like isoform X1 n=1 Tax=Zingiber officinale TaxID=94328 RepID=UPI001C4B40A0|nr:protein SOSEKI 3-like isoform X1 [Zingiber officinale]